MVNKIKVNLQCGVDFSCSIFYIPKSFFLLDLTVLHAKCTADNLGRNSLLLKLLFDLNILTKPELVKREGVA